MEVKERLLKHYISEASSHRRYYYTFFIAFSQSVLFLVVIICKPLLHV